MSLKREFCEFLSQVQSEFSSRTWCYEKESKSFFQIKDNPYLKSRKTYEIVIHCSSEDQLKVCLSFLNRIQMKLGAKYYRIKVQKDSLDVQLLLMAGKKLAEGICHFYFNRAVKEYLRTTPLDPNDPDKLSVDLKQYW